MWGVKKIVLNSKGRICGDKVFLRFKFGGGGIDYNLKEEIEDARKNFMIQEREVERLLGRLKKVEENGRFQRTWQDLKKKYGKLFYGTNSENISFDINILPTIEHCWVVSKCRKEKKKKVQKAIKCTMAFLKKYRIDAVYQGKPFVYLFSDNWQDYIDNAGRTVIKIGIPINMTVEKFREIIGKEYSRIRRIYSRSKYRPIVRKAKWGVKSGKWKYYKLRNSKIIKYYEEIKKQKFADTKIYEKIFLEFMPELEKEIGDSESLKPIIDKYKRREKE